MSDKIGKISHSITLVKPKLGVLGMEIKLNKEVTPAKNQEIWTLVKRRYQKAPLFPCSDTYNEKSTEKQPNEKV